MAEAANRQVILVGLDDSSASERALAQALELAKGRDADVHVVHVLGGYDPFQRLEYGAHEHLVDLSGENESLAARVATLVSAWERDHGAAPPTHTEVVIGRSAKTLADLAATRGAALIVVGNRNRSKLSRAVLGSVAEELLRRSTTTVLVVREQHDTHDTPS
ncbi:MAG: universal stress protein [Polyangiaceae bacterium]